MGDVLTCHPMRKKKENALLEGGVNIVVTSVAKKHFYKLNIIAALLPSISILEKPVNISDCDGIQNCHILFPRIAKLASCIQMQHDN